MLVKSICVLTLFCLMELFSIGCRSVTVVFRNKPAVETITADEGAVSMRAEVYPSPLQFAN